MYRCYIYDLDDQDNGLEFYLDLGFDEAWKRLNDHLSLTGLQVGRMWDAKDNEVFHSFELEEGVYGGGFCPMPELAQRATH